MRLLQIQHVSADGHHQEWSAYEISANGGFTVHIIWTNIIICGNQMLTRCNRGFYCRSYCLFNMFRAPLCSSSGAQEYYTGSCCLWYFVLWFSSSWSGVELRVMCPVCRMLQHPANRTHNPQLHTRPATWKTTAQNTTRSNHCIILLSSWWWA